MTRKLAAGLALLLAVGAGALLLSARQGQDPFGSAASPLQLVTQRFGADDYELNELRYFRLAAHKVNTEYVDPTRVDPDKMLGACLDRLGHLIPEFLWERADGSAALRVTMGSESTDLVAPRVESLSELTSVLAEVAAFIEQHLEDDVDRPLVEYALMNGMLETLDPHSVFIDPEAYNEMSITNKGHFGGLGITIGIRDGRLTILYPLESTPAWRAGLKAGDRIDRIGSESTVNMGLQEAVSKLRGEIGTQVTITVSDGDQPDREVTVTRDRISVPSVKFAYAGDGIGLVQVKHFAQDTYDKIEDAIDDLTREAAADRQGELKGVILDLRDNPGGYLQQAIQVADKFLRSGVIVSTDLLAQREKDVNYARSFGTESKLPLVVLVNEGSASASEIVAGALKRQDRAPVFGVRTFGKGSVQNLYDRDFNDGALKLTIAQYLTPGDHSIQGIGIEPDVELRPARVTNKDGDLSVQMFWQDFELREEDLDNPFDWGTADPDAERFVAVYADPARWSPAQSDHEPTPADDLEHLEVQAAKALLLARPSAKRSEMLEPVEGVLRELFQVREQQLRQELDGVGIDWTAAPPSKGKAPQARVTVEMKVGSESGMLTPGVKTGVTLVVTNSGDQPIHRLRAVTESDLMRGREYPFGLVQPGESRSYTVDVTLVDWLHAQTDAVTWHFFADGIKPPAPFVGRLQVEDVAHPRFAYSWQVIDDGTGKSEGNGDGLVQAGEAIDLLVTVRNIGDGPTSGLWHAARTGEEAVEKRGNLRLSNRSGESLFLVDGSMEFSLAAGEQTETRLHFRVADTVAAPDVIKGRLSVVDSRFFVSLASDVELPVHAATEAPSVSDKRIKPKKDGVAVRGGADPDSPIVGRLQGPVLTTGRLGGWWRVQLGEATGWVSSADVGSAGRGDELAAVEPMLANSPPVLRLAASPARSIVVGDELVVGGSVADDGGVKDVYVFVNGRKVGYQVAKTDGTTVPFSFTVPLEPGENNIAVRARDDQDLIGEVLVGVYRETATAAIAAPAKDTVTP
jgi:carboxyl-terminal processing protease